MSSSRKLVRNERSVPRARGEFRSKSVRVSPSSAFFSLGPPFSPAVRSSGSAFAWLPPKSVFPDGLTRWLGLPLSLYVAMYSKHNSWIDRADYDWKIDPLNREGGNALPLGQQFYTDLFRNGTDAGSAINDTFVLSLVVVACLLERCWLC